MNRRALLAGGLAVPALMLGDLRLRTQSLPTAEAPPAPFGPDTVPDLARALAARPHRLREDALPPAFARLDYDGYRRIVFDPAQALWADSGLPFQLQPHHRGFLFAKRVDLYEVAEGVAQPIRYAASAFRFDGLPVPEGDLGFSGFRITHPLNREGHFDELCVFQGASYFRALGRGQVYGLSARGLAIRTADRAGEEFPDFTAFWIERPARDARAITVHALLESESLTGAYRFLITPGETTSMRVEARLFPRVPVARLGIAPGTSMFWFGPNDRGEVSDYRPAVHDSDGLLMHSGAGERIWRPLNNPRSLQVSGFQDRAPRGFGLMQRRRDFVEYQDLEAEYHRRPGLWVEPEGDWGEGEVSLVEIPTRSEVHDNIVAAWIPRGTIPAGEERRVTYRLSWLAAPPAAEGLADFASTRVGAVEGVRAIRWVLDTARGGPTPDDARVESSAGEIRHVTLRANPETGGHRLTFELHHGSARLAELRAVLLRGGAPVSETWLNRWTA